MSSRWAERWLALLDDESAATALRRGQGHKLLRAGRVTDVRVGSGMVSGRVQGSRATPLVVEIAVPTLDAAGWTQVARTLAGQVRHSARLLAGQVPEGLEAELQAAGVPLFPGRVAASCHCDDSAPVCAHVAAVGLAAADAIDDDPFTLLRLRGRGRERLLADVAAARARDGEEPEPAGVEPADLDAASWTHAGDLHDLEAEPLVARPAAAQLRLLGDPPGWARGVSAADLFAPLVARAGTWARSLLR